MKKLVGIQAQATLFFTSVQMTAEEVRPELDHIWGAIKGNYAGQKVKQKGFRDRSVTQEELEEQNLTELYHDFWMEQLVEGVKKQAERPVAYVTEVTVVKQGNMFILNGMVYFQPEIKYNDSKEVFMQQLAEIFLADKPIEERHVEEEINQRRLRVQFGPGRAKVDPEWAEPFVTDDMVRVEITNEYAKAQGRPPANHILQLGDSCPEHYRNVLLGAKAGDNVIVTKEIDNSGQKVTEIIRIIGKVDAPPVDDEELLKSLDVPTMEALRFNALREMERNLTTNFDDMFSTFLRTRAKTSPIPGPMAFDRAEGLVNHMLTSQGKKSSDLSNPGQAVQSALPRINDEIFREVICADLAQDLALTLTEEEYQHCFKTNGMPDNPETRYVAEMDMLMKKVYTYYRTKGEDRGDPKLLITPSEAARLPPPPTINAERNNLLNLK